MIRVRDAKSPAEINPTKGIVHTQERTMLRTNFQLTDALVAGSEEHPD